MSKIHRALSYVSYWLNAVNQHSLQAPFIYEFYNKVIKASSNGQSLTEIESIRTKLIHSKHFVNVNDYGAGSSVENGSKRSVASIAKHGLTKRKYSELIRRIIDYLELKNILELGTSLGINTLYLSLNNNARITTFEGAEGLANIAMEIFEGNSRNNIETVVGNIDETLPEIIQDTGPVDMVYFDANHTYAATKAYFNICLKKTHDDTVFIFDDIHWSGEMEKAWNEIKSHYSVTLSIDLYQIGILFFNPELTKQHYILDF